jgi:single-strand DNA-binding protein
MALCKAVLIGNIGTEPELRYTPAGRPILRFRVACNRWLPPSPEGERRDETEWFTVLCFDRRAELYKDLLSKGNRVYVEGRLQTRSYEGRDGQLRFEVQVVATELQQLTPRPRPEGEQAVAPVTMPAAEADTENLDEVPF